MGALRMTVAARAMARAGVFALLVIFFGAEASAEDWTIKGKLFGELRNGRPVGSLDGDDYKKAEDISGIACVPPSALPRLCVVVDDEAQGAQILMLGDGTATAGSFIPLADDVFQRPDGSRKALDFDGEGVAYADNFFYVAGSHGRPRHEEISPDKVAEENAKAEVSRRLFRIPLSASSVDPDGELIGSAPAIIETGRLNDVIAAHPQISGASNAQLAEQGLNVEGIAVRGGTFYAGLRAPVNDGKAWMLEVPLAELFGQGQLTSKLVGLELGTDSRGNPRGIRDLAPFRDGLILIAGPALDPEDGAVREGDYTLFSIVDGVPAKLRDLPSYGAKVKPEAVLPLGNAGAPSQALLLFDGPEEGAGRTVTLTP